MRIQMRMTRTTIAATLVLVSIGASNMQGASAQEYPSFQLTPGVGVQVGKNTVQISSRLDYKPQSWNWGGYVQPRINVNPIAPNPMRVQGIESGVISPSGSIEIYGSGFQSQSAVGFRIRY